jgi:hypothetical protein
LSYFIEIAGVIVSIGAALGVVWKFMMPAIKDVIEREMLGSIEKLTSIEERLDTIEDLLARDYDSIQNLQNRQKIIRKGLMATIKSIEESTVMNNKDGIAVVKEQLINDLLDN